MGKYTRTEKIGYYYIYNKGNNERLVFKEISDYHYFLKILSSFLKKFSITLHNYTLVAKQYHLLIEIQQENMSDFMRVLNTNYSLYFNKKYNRCGKLWKARYKSWYIEESEIKVIGHYIENIPNMLNQYIDIKHYPYNAYKHFSNLNPPSYINNSWVYYAFSSKKELESFFTAKVEIKIIKKIKKMANSLTYYKEKKSFNIENIIHLFENITDKRERNKKIIMLHKVGYSQHILAKALKLSQPCICQIIKRST